MKALGLRLCVTPVFFLFAPLHAENPVIVHEWGTFTSLQDENGKAIGGINVDDEPVPGFVYGFGGVRALSDARPGEEFGLPPYFSGKGWMPGDQEVTMRLETPVLYFYPPKGANVPPLDVHVEWHGGILSQFYPFATLSGLPGNPPGAPTHVIQQNMRIGDVTSQLDWKGVQIGSTAQPIASTDKVWTTPRETSASLVQIEKPVAYDNGEVTKTAAEAEHFLFYRGVGHLDSPLKIDSTIRGTATAHSDSPDYFRLSVSRQDPAEESAAYSDSWLVQINEDGACSFVYYDMGKERDTGGWQLSPHGNIYKEGYFDRGNLAELKAAMQAALVKAGLYPDEASAMLRTWELSYFKSPGVRFFYIVPRTWVDSTLPLTVTGAPVEITRVMVGRIELISEEQQAALLRLSQEALPDLDGLKKLAASALAGGKFSKQEQQDFYSGARPLTDLGITLSASVRDYLSLGRFRDALLVHEQQVYPSENLARFIKENGLAAQ